MFSGRNDLNSVASSSPCVVSVLSLREAGRYTVDYKQWSGSAPAQIV
jgi:hypothetical protein